MSCITYKTEGGLLIHSLRVGDAAPSRIPAVPRGSETGFPASPEVTGGVFAGLQLYFARSIPPVCLVSVSPPKACLSPAASVAMSHLMSSQSARLIQKFGSLWSLYLLVQVLPRSAGCV